MNNKKKNKLERERDECLNQILKTLNDVKNNRCWPNQWIPEKYVTGLIRDHNKAAKKIDLLPTENQPVKEKTRKVTLHGCSVEDDKMFPVTCLELICASQGKSHQDAEAMIKE